ncbi:MAG: thioesterase family protein [Gordonia sp. (in: high G+C Gram-positive bacteria)]|uniref:acyl-CoA thioesterase domain-containing protein n=1 Tax=Gordonia sp. (in: high G+C Gram-positive bacteria) TaxID=84139 RepID=UPI0039E727D5
MQSLFTESADGVFVPGPLAVSGWGDQIRGLAVSALLARGAERRMAESGRDDLRPARWTLELFRPARMAPLAVTADVIRLGRRIGLIDVGLRQGDGLVARATALYLAPAEPVVGRVWSPVPDTAVPPTPAERVDDGVERLYRSGDGDWVTPDLVEPGAERNHAWQYPLPLLDGETPTPFQALAGAADVANAVLNMGTHGLEFINTDVTLQITRLPSGLEVGMSGADRIEGDGVMTGSVYLFDADGVVGLATIVGLANPSAAVDMRKFGRH